MAEGSMEAALQDCYTPEGANLSAIARKHGINRSTLWRHLNGYSGSKEAGIEKSRNLTNDQEQLLIGYIRRQCELCLPPTARIVSNIAAKLSGFEPSKNWSACFVERHRDKLDSRYLATLDLAQNKADSYKAYQTYFAILEQKIEEYGITAENMYNMDEEGFLLGQLQKTRRIFTKDTYKNNKLVVAGQDGSREWITVIASICADGTALKPSLIYKAVSGEVQDSWLQGFDPDQHNCAFAASPNGWTSDKHGMAWLEDIFLKETSAKARRRWRLLFVDGHGSHLNLTFLNTCYDNKILVAIYPPHSTHRLQPLDVGCFAPLASYYSQGLNNFIHETEGHTSISKRDFFTLFEPAWQKTFKPETIAKAWEKAGIFPLCPEKVLAQLPQPKVPCPTTPQRDRGVTLGDTAYILASPSAARSLRVAVSNAARSSTPKTRKILQQLSGGFCTIADKFVLAQREIKQLRQAVNKERNSRGRSKRLLETLRGEGASASLFMTPSKIRRARELAELKEQEQATQQEERERQTAAKALAKAQKEAEKEARRVARQEAALERQQKAAEKRVAIAERKAEAARKRAELQSQKLLRKATKELQKGSGTQAVVVEDLETQSQASGSSGSSMAELAPDVSTPTATTKSGRIVRSTYKLRL